MLSSTRFVIPRPDERFRGFALLNTRITLKRGKRGPSRFYTVLILPHAKSRFRKLHLSRAFVLSLVVLGLVAVVAGLAMPHLLFRLNSQGAVLDDLMAENRMLREQKVELADALGEVTRRLNDFEATAGRLADELGVKDLPVFESAAGGPSGQDRPASRRNWLNDELEAVEQRSSRLDDSLEQLDLAFRQRLSVLSHTPNTMPIEGWFSHGFGWRKDPFTGARQFHRGIDIVNDQGTPVRATADGVISRALRVSDYGKVIDISHGYGFVSRYGHLSEILIRPGERISRGDIIGRVGSTGRSTGPHLHYEVFRDGRRVNPWKYLGQR
jgi:murein DD-endopeptidase MepM/ murein hydrolase activator NlpD